MPLRRRPRRTETAAAAARYEEMGIAAALSRPWDYPIACGELAAVLRLAYAELPKAAQALAVRDSLLAFRLLPDVQTGYAVTAANRLLQAVEVALPKQKKALAVSEFKHSIVAHKRRAKVQQETGPPHIPHDVLLHVFSFLDLQSFVAAGFVCWAWNSAANDNTLWKMHYSLFFGSCHPSCKNIAGSSDVKDDHDLVVHNSTHPVVTEHSFSWKEAFQMKYAGCISLIYKWNRAMCRHCGSVIWLSNLTHAPHHCPSILNDEVKLETVLPHKVAQYILHGEDLATTASSSDSDDSDYDDYGPSLRFWSTLVDD